MKNLLVLALILVFVAGCTQGGKTITSENGKFVIEADDDNFYSGGEKITGISVKKGSEVEIEFRVRTTGVYYAGLGFKGCGVTSPDATPGQAVTVKFRADSNCGIISYWPANGAPKKTLDVAVE
jgi:hypothetical protein